MEFRKGLIFHNIEAVVNTSQLILFWVLFSFLLLYFPMCVWWWACANGIEYICDCRFKVVWIVYGKKNSLSLCETIDETFERLENQLAFLELFRNILYKKKRNFNPKTKGSATKTKDTWNAKLLVCSHVLFSLYIWSKNGSVVLVLLK